MELYVIRWVKNEYGLKKAYLVLELKLQNLSNKQRLQGYHTVDNVREMFNSLSRTEKNIFRYHAMLKPTSSDLLSRNNFDVRESWDGIEFEYWGLIDKNAFEEFDIDDETILNILQCDKINPLYFLSMPVKLLYQFDKSFLALEDEIDLWRYNTDFMKKRFDAHFGPDGDFEE